jgi:hypothetical protein
MLRTDETSVPPAAELLELEPSADGGGERAEGQQAGSAAGGAGVTGDDNSLGGRSLLAERAAAAAAAATTAAAPVAAVAAAGITSSYDGDDVGGVGGAGGGACGAGGSAGDAGGGAEQLPGQKLFQRMKEDFECEHCGHPQRGTGYTNHCERCLWSKHVDVQPGDRAAECGALMQPVAVDTKKAGYRILQRCVGCEHERWNKAQDDDDFEAILQISALHMEQEGGGGGSRGSNRGDSRGGRGRGKSKGGGRGGGRGKSKAEKGGRSKCLLKGRR